MATHVYTDNIQTSGAAGVGAAVIFLILAGIVAAVLYPAAISATVTPTIAGFTVLGHRITPGSRIFIEKGDKWTVAKRGGEWLVGGTNTTAKALADQVGAHVSELEYFFVDKIAASGVRVTTTYGSTAVPSADMAVLKQIFY